MRQKRAVLLPGSCLSGKRGRPAVVEFSYMTLLNEGCSEPGYTSGNNQWLHDFVRGEYHRNFAWTFHMSERSRSNRVWGELFEDPGSSLSYRTEPENDRQYLKAEGKRRRATRTRLPPQGLRGKFSANPTLSSQELEPRHKRWDEKELQTLKLLQDNL